MLLTTAGGLLVLLALVIVDNVLQPGTFGRLLLACVLWGSLLLALSALVVRRVLEDRRDDFFAALAERRHPELRNRLINALQLGRGNQQGFSPDLIAAIVRDASAAVADMELGDSLERRTLKRAAFAAGVALLVLGSYAVASWKPFTNGAARVLMPWANIDPFTRTQIVASSVKPGNARVPEGGSITIEAKAAGIIPTTAELHLSHDDGRRSKITMKSDPLSPEVFRASIPAGDSFRYRIAAGDGRSAEYRLEVVRRPQIEAITAKLTPPAYTQVPAGAPIPVENESARLPALRSSCR